MCSLLKKFTKIYDRIQIKILKLTGISIKMAVLGMEGSGKTSFINFLKDGDPGHPDQTVSSNNIDEYHFQTSDGRHFLIEKGNDISGQDTYRRYYWKIVDDNKLILFLFNSMLFCNNNDYRLEVIDRIAYISERINNRVENSTIKYESKIFYIVPTWKDKLTEININENFFTTLLLDSLFNDTHARPFSNPDYILPLSQTNSKDSLIILKDSLFVKL